LLVADGCTDVGACRPGSPGHRGDGPCSPNSRPEPGNCASGSPRS
jgi:hypothetical protein